MSLNSCIPFDECRLPVSETQISFGNGNSKILEGDDFDKKNEYWVSFLEEYSSRPQVLFDREPCATVIANNNVTPIRSDGSLRRSFESTFLLPKLRSYIISNIPLVQSYLSKNPDLLEFLICLADFFLEIKDVERVELLVYKDVEEGWEKLQVVARTQIVDVDRIIELEEFLFNRFLLHSSEHFSDRIIFSVGS